MRLFGTKLILSRGEGEVKLGGWVGRVGAGCLISSCWDSENVHLVFEV